MNAVIIEGKPIGETILQGEGSWTWANFFFIIIRFIIDLKGNIKYPFGVSSQRTKISLKTF